jgi:hypothetical protein
LRVKFIDERLTVTLLMEEGHLVHTALPRVPAPMSREQ